MHLQQQGRSIGDRVQVVGGVGSIGRSDLLEDGAAPGHDLGDPKRPSNLDQFATRDDDLFARGQRIQSQQHRGGVVVYNGRSLGTREIHQHTLDRHFTPPAISLGEVVLEIHGLRCCQDEGVNGRLRQQRAAQVRVQHGTRRVDDALQSGLGRSSESSLEPCQNRIVFECARLDVSVTQGRPQFVENVAESLHDVLSIEPDE